MESFATRTTPGSIAMPGEPMPFFLASDVGSFVIASMSLAGLIRRVSGPAVNGHSL